MSRIDSEALVVRTVDLRDGDVIATLVTEQVGKISAVVHGGRKASRRVGGALEPVHTIRVLLEDRGTDLTTLKESHIERARTGVVACWESLEAAGLALRWARHLFPARTPEPEGWGVLIELLDGLEAGSGPPRTSLARAGLAMLSAMGYALDFDQCVACGRPCPPDKAACVDPARGGLICRACGGACTVLPAGARLAARSLVAGDPQAVTEADAERLLALVARAMAAHAGFER